MTVTTVDAGPRKIARAAEVNAPATEIFELVADPRRHHELDGGGTVQNAVTSPDRLSADAKFSVQMKQYGFPYKITSKVIDFTDGTVVEWQHPLGHSWRWELKPLTENTTLVTETFDYSRLGAAKVNGLKWFGSFKHNAAAIEATLRQLQAKYPAAPAESAESSES
ncbi:MAG TPA: SRPBCC family protein [Streptosporangiaceae bacterium]